jgi:hypothetical protein
MVEELEKELEIKMAPLADYVIENIEAEGQRIRAMMEIAAEVQAIIFLTESPSISQQTRDSLDRDFARLRKKFRAVRDWAGKEDWNERHGAHEKNGGNGGRG